MQQRSAGGTERIIRQIAFSNKSALNSYGKTHVKLQSRTNERVREQSASGAL